MTMKTMAGSRRAGRRRRDRQDQHPLRHPLDRAARGRGAGAAGRRTAMTDSCEARLDVPTASPSSQRVAPPGGEARDAPPPRRRRSGRSRPSRCSAPGRRSCRASGARGRRRVRIHHTTQVSAVRPSASPSATSAGRPVQIVPNAIAKTSAEHAPRSAVGARPAARRTRAPTGQMPIASPPSGAPYTRQRARRPRSAARRPTTGSTDDFVATAPPPERSARPRHGRPSSRAAEQSGTRLAGAGRRPSDRPAACPRLIG